MTSVGDRTKQVRKELSLTQAVVARRTGISQAALSELENGESKGTKEIAKLAAVLGVSPIWLSDGKGDKLSKHEITIIQSDIPENVLKLAEKLLLLPADKLKALSVLVGIKF